MFSKLKNFSEDVAKSISDLSINEQQAQKARSNGLITELKNNSAILSTTTPNEQELTQPTEVTEDAKVSDINIDELSPVLKSKMKKFAKYEEKYPILLEAYKMEKRKTELIGSFEKVLREVSPISSISDAGLLVEYLNGLTEKQNLSNLEIKRLNRDLIESNKTNKNLNNQLVILSDKIKIIQDDTANKSTIKSLNDDLVSQKSQFEEKLNDMKEKLKDTKEKLNQKQEEIDRLKLSDSVNAETEKLDAEKLDAEKSTEKSIEKSIEKSTEKSIEKPIVDTKSDVAKDDSKDESVIDELKSKIDTLTVENKDLLSKLKTNKPVKDKDLQDSKVKELTSTVKTLKVENKELQSKVNNLEEAENSKSVLEAKIKELEKQNQDIKLELLKGSEEKSELNLKVEELTLKQTQIVLESDSLKSKIADYDNQVKLISEYEVKVKDLSSKVNELNSKIQDQKQTVTPAAKKKGNNKKSKKNNASTVNQEQVDLDALQAKLDEATSSKKTLEEQLLKINAEHEIVSKDFVDVVAEKRFLRQELNLKVEELDTLKDLLREIGDDLCQARDEIKDFKLKNLHSTDNGQKLKDASSKVENITKELELISGKNVELELALQKKGDEHQAVTAELNDLKSTKKRLDEEVAEISKKLDSTMKDSKSKISQLEKEVESYFKKQDVYKSAENDLKAENEKLLEKINTLNKKISSLDRQVEELKKDKTEMNNRINEFNKLKGDDASLKLEIASLTSSLTHKNEKIKEFKENIDDLSKQKDDLNKQISNLNLKISNLEYENKSLVQEKSDLLSKQELSSERTAALSNELSKKQIERQTIATELEKLKTKYESIVKDKQSASDQMQSFKQEYEEISMKAKETAMRFEGLEDELNESRTLLQERTRESMTIKRLLIEAEELSKSKEAHYNSEIQKLMEEIEYIKSDNERVVHRKQREINESQRISEDYSIKIFNLEKEVAELSSKIEEAKNNSSDGKVDDEVQKTIDTLRQSLQATSKRVRDYESINNTLKKLNEESDLKFDRLSKNYKILTQQYRQMKSPSNSDVASRKNSIESTADSSESDKGANIAYLKNVLLGFFEHKEQRDQLLPVVKTLFSFTPEDERKFLVALK